MERNALHYNGDATWSHGPWHIVGNEITGVFDLWLFVWQGIDTDPNTAMKHVGTFDTLCDIENWLRKAKVTV